MKKIILSILIIFILLSCLQCVVFASEPIVTDQKITFEGQYINITEPIMNIDGSIYVPVRTFCEKIGFTVEWDIYGITLIGGRTEYYILNEDYTNIQGKSYVSLRFLGKLLDLPVGYNDSIRTAYLGKEPELKKENVKISKVVMIDPGHGGADPGAIGHEVNEKDVNLIISSRVRELLEKDGITVIMTRDTDKDVSLSGRAEYANEQGVDLFISIHNNSAESTEARGTEVLCHFETYSSVLAKNILDGITERINTTNRGLKDGSRMAVIRKTSMPAVIVEGLFLSNKEDAEMLKNKDILYAIAEGIYVGIKNSL